MSDSRIELHADALAHPEEHKHDVSKHVRAYLFVGALLFLFTALTVALSYVDFGSIRTNIVIALIVATVKASLVAAVFMHLSSEKWTIYRFLLVTAFFAMGLFLLTWLAYANPIHLRHVP